MLYTVQYGDSPAIIARRFGVSTSALIGANPQKPTTVVAGYQTWRDLRTGETLRVPVAGFVGDALSDLIGQILAKKRATPQVDLHLLSNSQLTARGLSAAEGGTFVNRAGVHLDRWGRPVGHGPMHHVTPAHHAVAIQAAARGLAHRVGAVHGLGDSASDALQALMTAGSPCNQANVALVCAAQAAMGLGVDGKWGGGTAQAAASRVPGAPGACTPRPSWWAPPGKVNCPPASVPTPTPPPSSSALDQAAAAALAAISSDPSYCTSVGRAGSAVNTAVHNFKAAWNAANPGNQVPIGTGKFEPSVSAALSSALSGQSVPAGCGGVAPAPAPTPVPTPAPSIGPGPVPVPGPAPSAGGGNLSSVAQAAVSALSADANYCASVGQVGTAVNTAVHNFKVAWNAANPSSPVPIGTGKFEPAVAAALASALGGATVPAGCGAAPAPIPAPVPTPAPTPVPSPAPAPTPGLPPPPPPPPPPSPVPSPTPTPTPSPAPGPSGPSAGGGGGGGGGPVVVAPTTGGISTGAIVAGAVGVVALVGVVAAASMSGKGGAGGAAGHRGARGGRGKRGAHGHASHKATKHKTTKHKGHKKARR